MADESHSERRPSESALVPLRREVEAPRTAAGLWLPVMALASAAMLTITSGIAVMTRPPRAHLDAPATSLPARVNVDPAVERARRIEALREEAKARMDAAPRVLCRVAVYRGNIDGEEQPYDECIVSPDVAAKASTGPEAR